MAEKINEPFIRPNIDNQGTRPDENESISQSPDIWCAGDKPVFNFQKVLADDDHYGIASEEGYVQGHDNYFYLRFKNGSDKPVKDMCAELYYQEATLINWVSDWKRIPVEGQNDSDTVNHFDTVEPDAVGVAKAPFLLRGDLAAGENYCLIARLWSREYHNDKPTDACIYIGQMLKKNMLWGQLNMEKISVRNVPNVVCKFNLSVPAESSYNSDIWYLILESTNAVNTGIEIEIRNSRTDDDGNQILLERCPVYNNFIVIGRHRLKGGYHSQISAYFYLPKGFVHPDNMNFTVKQALEPKKEEYRQAKRLGLLNDNLKNRLMAELKNRQEAVDNIDGVICMGEYTICLRP